MPTEQQRNNLRKLAEELRKPLPVKFDMEEYAADNEEENLSLYECDCGTVMCAMGYGAVVFPEIVDEIVNQGKGGWGGWGWDTFGLKAFGAAASLHFPGAVTDEESDLYGWLFSPSWKETDNTKEGAAARIEWYLEHGIPEDALDAAAPEGMYFGAHPGDGSDFGFWRFEAEDEEETEE